MNVPLVIGLFLLQTAFCAGGGWFMLRQMRRDMNGIGSKLRNLGLAIIVAAPDEKKEEVATLVIGGR